MGIPEERLNLLVCTSWLLKILVGTEAMGIWGVNFVVVVVVIVVETEVIDSGRRLKSMWKGWIIRIAKG